MTGMRLGHLEKMRTALSQRSGLHLFTWKRPEPAVLQRSPRSIELLAKSRIVLIAFDRTS